MAACDRHRILDHLRRPIQEPWRFRVAAALCLPLASLRAVAASPTPAGNSLLHLRSPCCCLGQQIGESPDRGRLARCSLRPPQTQGKSGIAMLRAACHGLPPLAGWQASRPRLPALPFPSAAPPLGWHGTAGYTADGPQRRSNCPRRDRSGRSRCGGGGGLLTGRPPSLLPPNAGKIGLSDEGRGSATSAKNWQTPGRTGAAAGPVCRRSPLPHQRNATLLLRPGRQSPSGRAAPVRRLCMAGGRRLRPRRSPLTVTPFLAGVRRPIASLHARPEYPVAVARTGLLAEQTR